MASSINALKHGSNYSSAAYEAMMKKLMYSVSKLVEKVTIKINQKKKPTGDLGSLFGLTDPSSFIKPPPSQLKAGLNKADFMNTFGK